MATETVNESRYTRHAFTVSRLDERGWPIEIVWEAPDIETAIELAEALGPNYTAGTWAYRN